MLSLTPSLSCFCGVFCQSLISASFFFLYMCVSVCVWLFVVVQLCVRVCLCSRYLGSVHPTYLCQLKLLKPSQPGVHTGDSTHTVHTAHTHTRIQRATNKDICLHFKHINTAHTNAERHTQSLFLNMTFLCDGSCYVSLSLLPSPLPFSSLPATPSSCLTLPAIPSFLLPLWLSTSVSRCIFQQQ